MLRATECADPVRPLALPAEGAHMNIMHASGQSKPEPHKKNGLNAWVVVIVGTLLSGCYYRGCACDHRGRDHGGDHDRGRGREGYRDHDRDHDRR
jgi:hypothetical protein